MEDEIVGGSGEESKEGGNIKASILVSRPSLMRSVASSITFRGGEGGCSSIGRRRVGPGFGVQRSVRS